jgi:hypothetical protein
MRDRLRRKSLRSLRLAWMRNPNGNGRRPKASRRRPPFSSYTSRRSESGKCRLKPSLDRCLARADVGNGRSCAGFGYSAQLLDDLIPEINRQGVVASLTVPSVSVGRERHLPAAAVEAASAGGILREGPAGSWSTMTLLCSQRPRTCCASSDMKRSKHLASLTRLKGIDGASTQPRNASLAVSVPGDMLESNCS